ncbi:MAG: hypothetical protein ACPLZ9_04990 [Candidatus Ratteibacteria bacterium]
MEIREALKKILDFVVSEEAKNEADAYSYANVKDWHEVRVSMEKMGCFSEVRGFIEAMIDDLDEEERD